MDLLLRMKSNSLNSMAFATDYNSYDSVMKEMEKVVKSKYESRIIELEKKNLDLQLKQPYIGMAQMQQGSIGSLDAYALAGTGANTCISGSNIVAIQPTTKKKDIKSLIAYYYNR